MSTRRTLDELNNGLLFKSSSSWFSNLKERRENMSVKEILNEIDRTFNYQESKYNLKNNQQQPMRSLSYQDLCTLKSVYKNIQKQSTKF